MKKNIKMNVSNYLLKLVSEDTAYIQLYKITTFVPAF